MRTNKMLGNKESSVTWPNDADGEVLRRLEADGFDFSKSYTVDYNIDFDSWPPALEALELLKSKYGNIEVYEPDEDYAGYVQFQINAPITYEGVTSTQRNASSAMQPFGGVCESWGIMH